MELEEKLYAKSHGKVWKLIPGLLEKLLCEPLCSLGCRQRIDGLFLSSLAVYIVFDQVKFHTFAKFLTNQQN